MLKIITLIGFLCLTIGGFAQKANYFIADPTHINSHRYFYLSNCNIDIHDLTSPFINKMDVLKSKEGKYFILYYELSLKNMMIIDSDKEPTAVIINFYEANEFDNKMVYPPSYKVKKIRTSHFILDIVSAGSGNLIYRSWMDSKKIKLPRGFNREQHAITLLLKGFTIQPLPLE